MPVEADGAAARFSICRAASAVIEPLSMPPLR
jgi:hypothetical protein